MHCSLNLEPDMYITKESKWHPSCHHHDNQYAAGPVLIKTKIIRLNIKQGSSTPNKLMGRVRQHVNYVFQARPSHLKTVQMGIFFFYGKILEPRVLPW